jgi:mutator protein MutT
VTETRRISLIRPPLVLSEATLPERSDTPSSEATVCFIRRDGKVLLQRRAPGRIWAGRLNGPGGKVAAEETADEAVAREVVEETGLTLLDAVHHGTLDLVFGEPEISRLRVFVYTCDRFTGRARGGREGRLRWYAAERLPYHELWPDMRFWLPVVLAGGTVNGTCVFDRTGARLLSSALELTWRGPSVR